MTKINWPTGKFYPQYPVFVLAMRRGEELYASTYSSSFTLQDLLVVGMSREGRTAQALEIGQPISVNFLSENDGLISDICGNLSGRQREQMLKKAGIVLDEIDGLPTFQAAHLTLIGKVQNIVAEGGYLKEEAIYQTVFIKIEQRLIDDKLLKDDKIDWAEFRPLEYLGDGALRLYKPELRPNLDYFKEYRKNVRK